MELRNLFSFRIAAVACLVILAAESSAMDIVAHRGASFDAPENTVASAKLAWQQDADAVELDLHLSKEGELIVLHDFSTRRISDHDSPVAALTVQEIKQIDAGRWKGAQFTGEKVPTFQELLATLPAGRRLFIELKVGPEIVPVLAAALERHRVTPAQAVIISFNYETLVAAKRRLPAFDFLWLLGRPAKTLASVPPTAEELIQDCRVAAKSSALPQTALNPPYNLSTAIGYCRAAGFAGLDVNREWPLDTDAVALVKAAGLQLHVWVVDDAATARRLQALGVDGITTNRPGWLRNELHLVRVGLR